MMRRAILIAVGALALFSLACGRERSSTPTRAADGPIVIISVDTLRADRLPAYGAHGVETPNFDALASDSIVFDSAWSQVPLTLPSHASMFTGRLPAAINVRNNLGYSLDPSIPSLPAILSSAGWRTGAAVSAWVLRKETGFGMIFDHYDDRMESSDASTVGQIQRAGPATVDAAIEWLKEGSGSKAFLFVHLFEPHTPYAPPEPFASKYADSPYDGEIAAADAAVGRLLDHLKNTGDYDRATILFMSDHGEGLGDHGELEHGIFLYREAIQVPLFLKLPAGARAGSRVDSPVALLDVFSTILEVAGVDPARYPSDGVSLLETARSPRLDRRIFSETMYPRIHLGWSDLASLAGSDFHYIEAPRPELYDLRNDPGEKVNVIAEERRTFAAMRREIAGYERALAAPSAISDEDAARLSALGYLGGGSADSGGELPDPKDRIGDLELYTRAGQHFRTGAHAEAISLLREVVSSNPTFADAWTLLAKSYSESGRIEEAIQAYRRTIEAAPSLSAGTGLSLGQLYLQAGHFQEAIDHADLAAQAHPAEARLVRAGSFLGLRDPARAEQEVLPLTGDPRYGAEATVLLARIRIAQKRVSEALAALNAVESSGASVANLSFAKGDALARLGRMDEARAAMLRETQRFPGNREAWIRLAAINLLAGDVAAAERVMSGMVAANPDSSSYAMVAEAYRGLGRPDLASKWERAAR
jgi:choline-sulfatase